MSSNISARMARYRSSIFSLGLDATYPAAVAGFIQGALGSA